MMHLFPYNKSVRVVLTRLSPRFRNFIPKPDTVMGADETQIEATFCAAIRTAKQQKSLSLANRAEASYAQYRSQKLNLLRRNTGQLDSVDSPHPFLIAATMRIELLFAQI
jgi:hypothetical protein